MKPLFVSALVLSVLAARPALAIGLDEAVAAAAANSHEIKQLRLESESASWGETRARAGYMPRLQASGRHLFAESFMQLPVEFGGTLFEMPAIEPYTAGSLTASIEVFSGFQTENEVEAAKLATRSAERRLARGQEKLRAGVRTLFYRALGSQVLVDVADQNIATLEGHLSEVNSRVRSGVSTRFDSLRAEVQLEEARTEKAYGMNAIATTRARFFEALGIPDDGKPLEGQLPTEFARYEKVDFSTQDVQRDDRLAQQLAADSMGGRARAAKAAYYPKVSLFGSQTYYNAFNHSTLDTDERFRSASSFGLALTWNLYDGGESYAVQKQAALAERIAQEKLAQLDRSIPVDLDEAKRPLSYDLLTFRAKQSSVRKAEEAVRLARGGAQAGTRTNTEVLDAVVDLNRAKAATVKAQVDAIEAIGQLELALGRAI